MKNFSKKELDEMVAAKNTVETIRVFNSIISAMRKSEVGTIREIPEDEQRGGAEIEKVRFPESGGTLTFYKGLDQPAKGFPNSDSVEKADDIKKNIIVMLTAAAVFSKRKMLAIIVFLLFKKEIKKIFQSWVNTTWITIQPLLLKEERYCDFVREIRRVFVWDDKLKDIVSMILEFDDGYRYRIQDTLQHLNKDGIQNKTIKEIKKIFERLEEKETQNVGYHGGINLRDKWTLMKKIIPFLIFVRPLFKDVRLFLVSLNLDQIKMSKEDLYYCQKKFGYKWDKIVS